MSKEVKIEKNIPVPKAYFKTTERIQLLQKMEVGDSVLVDTYPEAARQLYFNPAKRLGMHIIVRKTPDGTRMWRDK
jgi:hypothetical protein